MTEDHPAGRPPHRQARAPDRAGPLTVADVLALPVLAAGLPRVVAGESRLDRPVRWVHITELTDPASFLKGGELVLTTGMPLPDEPARVRRYVDELAGVGAAALVIELVRRYHRPPEALVRACRAHDLPLVTLAQDVNFLEVTQVVHTLVLGSQTEAMLKTQRIHEAFTALTLRGAAAEDVVRAAAEMSGHTVVLENLVHQAVLCEPSGGTVEEALTDWERHSRATPAGDRTAVRGPGGWLVAPVEFRGERWGRAVMLPAPGAEPPFRPEDVTVLERTAMTLTIARLVHATTWERGAHRNALRDIAGRRHRSPGEAVARVAALGLPTGDCRYLAVVADVRGGPEAEARLAEELSAAGIPALTGELAPGRIGSLLALRPAQPPWRTGVERLARAARHLDPHAVVGVGSEVPHLCEAARSFREAAHVAEAVLPGAAPASSAAPHGPPRRPAPADHEPPAEKSFHELSDIGLRQLLYALREDIRIQEYAERTLGRLADHDTRHGTDLLTTLRHYLDAAGNKTVAARRGELSRQTLYQRLHAIERLLGCDLASGERRSELHVALMAYDVLRLRRPADGRGSG